MATAVAFSRAANGYGNGGQQMVQDNQLIVPQGSNNCNTRCATTVYEPQQVLSKKEVFTPQVAYRPTTVVQEQMCIAPDPCAPQCPPQYVQQPQYRQQQSNCNTGYQYSYGCGWGGGVCGIFFGIWLAASVIAGIAIWALNPRWAQRGGKSKCGKNKCEDDCKDKCNESCLDGGKILITAIIIGLIIAALIALLMWVLGCFC